MFLPPINGIKSVWVEMLVIMNTSSLRDGGA